MEVSEENIINVLRGMMLGRAVNQGEAFILAEAQAAKLLEVLDIGEVPVDISRICDLPEIAVEVEPRHKIPRLAGFTEQQEDGRWVITVNENESRGERRQTLAHEFKHILDDPIRRTAYARLGFGDEDRHFRAIEAICDHFAACALMPRTIFKKVWLSGIKCTEALADFFDVSEEAVVDRLEYLGLTNGGRRPIKQYFRHRVAELLPAS